MSEIKMKYCKHCNKEFPSTSEYFYVNKSPHSSDGLRPYCKPCQQIMNKLCKDKRKGKLSTAHLKLARKLKVNLFRAEISKKMPKHLQKPVELKINDWEPYWSNEDWLYPYYRNWNDLYLPVEQWDADYWKLKNEIDDRKLANKEVPKDWRDDARMNSYMRKDDE